MAITWGEKPNSLETTVSSATFHYVLTGTNVEVVALALASGFSPALYTSLYRTDIQLKQIGFEIWDVTIPYGAYQKKKPEDGDFSYTFDTTGGTKHITEGLSHTADYQPAGKNAIDHNGAIGVTEDGSVEGVDVIDHSFKWVENRRLLLADFGWTYTDILDDMTGKVNDEIFRNKPAFTVVFEGATGSQSQKDPLFLEVAYNFAYSRSATGLTIGGITGIDKTGWDYLWVRYETADGGLANKLTTIPRQVDVDRVYFTEDFSLLGIGTT